MMELKVFLSISYLMGGKFSPHSPHTRFLRKKGQFYMELTELKGFSSISSHLDGKFNHINHHFHQKPVRKQVHCHILKRVSKPHISLCLQYNPFGALISNRHHRGSIIGVALGLNGKMVLSFL